MPSYSTLFLLLLAGAITAFSFSPFDVFFIPYLTFAFLFQHWLGKSPRYAFISAYLFGLGFFGLGLGWLYISIHLFGGVGLSIAILLTILLVLFLALYPGLCGYLSQRFFPTGRVISLLISMPACWALTEWLRSWVFTGFPWLSIGYSQTDTPLAAYASLGGVFLVSWLTLMLAACVALMYQGQGRERAISVVTAIVLLLAGMVLQQHSWTAVKDDDIKVALIQGAIPQRLKWLPEYRQDSLAWYLSLTEPHWGSDIIIWPETAIPAYYHQALPFLDQLQAVARHHNSTVLTGLPIQNQATGEYYNSIVLLGQSRQQYHKRHLVPFGEYVPLPFLLDSILHAMQIPISNFTPGDSHSKPVLKAGSITLGLSICYEGIFGNEIIRALPEAELLVNVSNDAWFGNSAAPHQHLQMARMRSMETGRYMLRATNTGISAIFDEKGQVISQSEQFRATSNSATVKTFTGDTPYSRWGNYPLVFCLFGVLAGLVLLGKRIN